MSMVDFSGLSSNERKPMILHHNSKHLSSVEQVNETNWMHFSAWSLPTFVSESLKRNFLATLIFLTIDGKEKPDENLERSSRRYFWNPELRTKFWNWLVGNFVHLFFRGFIGERSLKTTFCIICLVGWVLSPLKRDIEKTVDLQRIKSTNHKWSHSYPAINCSSSVRLPFTFWLSSLILFRFKPSEVGVRITIKATHAKIANGQTGDHKMTMRVCWFRFFPCYREKIASISLWIIFVTFRNSWICWRMLRNELDQKSKWLKFCLSKSLKETKWDNSSSYKTQFTSNSTPSTAITLLRWNSF